MTRERSEFQQDVVLLIPIATAAADATTKIFRATSAFRIDRAWLIAPAGLAQDATNYVVAKLQHSAGPKVAFQHSTRPVANGGQGTLAANTWTAMTKLVDGDCVIPAGGELSFFADENGDTTWPAATVQIEGRYL